MLCLPTYHSKIAKVKSKRGPIEHGERNVKSRADSAVCGDGQRDQKVPYCDSREGLTP